MEEGLIHPPYSFSLKGIECWLLEIAIFVFTTRDVTFPIWSTIILSISLGTYTGPMPCCAFDTSEVIVAMDGF